MVYFLQMIFDQQKSPSHLQSLPLAASAPTVDLDRDRTRSTIGATGVNVIEHDITVYLVMFCYALTIYDSK